MNKLIIIGNGFDLAHGLKTSFKDFLNYCAFTALAELENLLNIKKYKREFDENNDYVKFYTMIDYSNELVNKAYNIYVYSGKSNSQKNKDKAYSLFCFNYFFKFIAKKVINNSNWSGIENDFYDALLHVAKLKSASEFNDIEKIRRNFLIYDLNLAFEKLINYLCKYLNLQDSAINSQKIFNTLAQILFSPFDGNNMVLNFNYTKTFDLYKQYFDNTKVIHIHGELNNKDNPIIFGYGDDIDEHYSKLENLRDNAYLKFAKSLHYQLTDNYKQLLDFIDADEYEIYILGHSCGSSDKVLLNTIFEHNNCTKITPIYHQNGNTDNYFDLITNISRNFSDKKRFRSIVENKKTCAFL